MLNLTLQNIIMLNVIVLNVILLNGKMLNVAMLNVALSFHPQQKVKKEPSYSIKASNSKFKSTNFKLKPQRLLTVRLLAIPTNIRQGRK
jgi:hypothetical protein